MKKTAAALSDFLCAYLEEHYPPFNEMSENARMYTLIMLGSLILKFMSVACKGSIDL